MWSSVGRRKGGRELSKQYGRASVPKREDSPPPHQHSPYIYYADGGSVFKFRKFLSLSPFPIYDSVFSESFMASS